VTIAKDGQEALDMVRESMRTGQRFGLVFMDVQMPNLDGIQSTKRIREMGFSAPIVALTAFAEESNIKDCYDSGMDFFLPKPIKRRELKKVLNKYYPPIHEEEGENPVPAVSGDDSAESPGESEKNDSTTEVGVRAHDLSNGSSTVTGTTSESDSNGNSNGTRPSV
jgi:osomolarity two-component system, sensor histidine kinase SLN1